MTVSQNRECVCLAYDPETNEGELIEIVATK